MRKMIPVFAIFLILLVVFGWVCRYEYFEVGGRPVTRVNRWTGEMCVLARVPKPDIFDKVASQPDFIPAQPNPLDKIWQKPAPTMLAWSDCN